MAQIIRLDEAGRIAGIAFNNLDRAPLLLRPDDVSRCVASGARAHVHADCVRTQRRLPRRRRRARRFYDYYGRWCALAADPALSLWLLLEAGDSFIFDNRRILHGRSSFDARSPRQLGGFYLNSDDFDSRMRTLEKAVAAGAAPVRG